MLEKAKSIIYSIPIQEVIDYYCYFTEDCCGKTEECDYRYHLYSKLRQVIRFHRYKGKVNLENTFRAYNMYAWLDAVEKKYIAVECLQEYYLKESGV